MDWGNWELILALGGITMTSIIAMGKMMYRYGRDRKELNGTVERVKDIDRKLDEHIHDEAQDLKGMRRSITEIGTKVDLLIDQKIKGE